MKLISCILVIPNANLEKNLRFWLRVSVLQGTGKLDRKTGWLVVWLTTNIRTSGSAREQEHRSSWKTTMARTLLGAG